MAAVENYANNATTTVTSGGATAGTSGTVESWGVTSSATFPAASAGVTQFHVGDPAQPSELIAVTAVAGTAWTVTRGAESTTPVSHAPGFTVDQVITAGGLNGLLPTAGGSMSGVLAMGGNKVTGLAYGSGTTDAMAFGQQIQNPGPGVNLLQAWSYDIASNGSNTGTIAQGGAVYLSAFTLYYPTTLSKIWWINTVAGTTPTSGQSQVGIYSSGGSLVASATATATASAVTVGGVASAALSSSYAAAAGVYWVGMVFQAATEPTILRTGVNNGTYLSLGTTAASYRWAVNGTAVTTALPSTINTLSNTLTGSQSYWVGIS